MESRSMELQERKNLWFRWKKMLTGYQDIIKFTLSSLSSFGLDYVFFLFFTAVIPNSVTGILIANVMARVISGIYNYLINCKFVFRKQAKTQTAFQYLLLAAGILLMNNVILEFYHMICHIPLRPAKIATELSLFLMSFVIQHVLIFKNRR